MFDDSGKLPQQISTEHMQRISGWSEHIPTYSWVLSQERFQGELFVLDFVCFFLPSFGASFEKLFVGSTLGNNAEASLGNFFGLRRCPRGFWSWEISRSIFERLSWGCLNRGNFLRNYSKLPWGSFEWTLQGEFGRELAGWFFENLTWPQLPLELVTPPISEDFRLHSFIVPSPWKFPRLKVHFRAELRPENFAQLSKIQQIFSHSASAKLWLLYAAVHFLLHIFAPLQTHSAILGASWFNH